LNLKTSVSADTDQKEQFFYDNGFCVMAKNASWAQMLLRGGEEGWEGRELYQREICLDDLDTYTSMEAWWM